MGILYIIVIVILCFIGSSFQKSKLQANSWNGWSAWRGFPVAALKVFAISLVLMGILSLTFTDFYRTGDGNYWVRVLMGMITWSAVSAVFWLPVMIGYVLSSSNNEGEEEKQRQVEDKG